MLLPGALARFAGLCADAWLSDRLRLVWRALRGVNTSWQCVRVQSSETALRGNFVATRGRCKVALSSVQIEVNVGVRVSKTLRATTQRNDLHVLCPSDACVQNGVKKQ